MNNPHQPIDVLHLAGAQAEQMGRELNRQDDNSRDACRRKHGRFSYIIPEGITVEIESPGGASNCAYRVCPRNISAGGMAFLHGGFIHPGTRCHITLMALDEERVTVSATIRSCRYVTGKVHHVGAEFETPINVTDYAFEADPSEPSLGLMRGPASRQAAMSVAPASAAMATAREFVTALRELQTLAQSADQLIKQISSRLAQFQNTIVTPASPESIPEDSVRS